MERTLPDAQQPPLCGARACSHCGLVDHIFRRAITTGYTYFFGYQNFAMHMAMTGTLAATLALVVVLIVALDYPFRGEISVTPDPFIMTQVSWAEIPLGKK